ncbi:acetate kinase [Aureibaculum sp. 2210JD6-5]|uniref:acetate/propionate family kinase n=1 Tax=Aureibaculum sp. 2210JD6-5 TaxID=3103957 RepID=UPI002AAF0467|nr:acetate kinase [Aureibaculum sp. 2210JD6-5]MDY7396633.1 acetate kinase [Aureibaculum sp. 2210JD6-5]
MKILIINSGSSSIKFQLIAMPTENVICQGIVERIGAKDAIFQYKTETSDLHEIDEITSHKIGLHKIADYLLDTKIGVIEDTDEIDVIGHRVVHGGNTFSDTTLITTEVKSKIKDLNPLAPLHNPHNLEGIILTEQIFTNAKQVAVFDTAFHQTIPIKAKKYAIPNTFYENNNIQLYGFHGTSHKFVTEKAIEHLQKNESRIITIHLGNGCSITAVKNGKSMDHSLGFAPSNGLIMGSRSGDIDHSIIFYLVNKLGYNLNEVNKLLTKESGMLGLTGYSDLREIEAQAENGNTTCMLALEMNVYRIKKYIGAYIAVMNGLDAIVFTAGIGENSSTLRKMICNDMDYLGINLDDARNSIRSKKLRQINTEKSQVKILVVPTNEEIEIAKQAFKLCS